MTKKTEKHCMDLDIVCKIAQSHPELKGFVNAFIEMQEANKRKKKAKLTVCIGEAKKNGFISYLTSSVDNPRVLFTSGNAKSGECIPQIIISNRRETITMFALNDLHIISSKTEKSNDCKYESELDFDRYKFIARIGRKINYSFTMIIYKR